MTRNEKFGVALLFMSVAMAGLGKVAVAADEGLGNEPRIVRLAITPAAEPRPALRYRLSVSIGERRPGNAALDYHRAASSYRTTDERQLQITEWLKLPADEFAVAVREHRLDKSEHKAVLDLVRLGASRDDCTFQTPIRDQPFMWILLPEVMEMRKLARLTALTARVQSSVGKYDEAVALLQSGYALGRHLGGEPTLVSSLAGLSITELMNPVVLDLAQRPGSPSLYWALTFMPPPVDWRAALEAELDMYLQSFPELADVGDTAGTEAEWTARLSKLTTKWHDAMEHVVPFGTTILPAERTTWDRVREQAEVRRRMVLLKPKMIALLARHGYAERRIAAMGEAELTLIYSRLLYEELRDDAARWAFLPYPEAARGMAAAAERRRKTVEHDEILPLAKLLLTELGAARHTTARAERHRDVLRLVEALRLYAGSHDGRLPESLDELTDAPAPQLDAITGRPFDYTLDDRGIARLVLPDDRRERQPTLIYEVRVKK